MSFANTSKPPRLQTTATFTNYQLQYNFKTNSGTLTAKKTIPAWLVRIANKGDTTHFKISKDQKTMVIQYITPVNYTKLKAALVQVSLPRAVRMAALHQKKRTVS